MRRDTQENIPDGGQSRCKCSDAGAGLVCFGHSKRMREGGGGEEQRLESKMSQRVQEQKF
jgi:hypothetical protein